jgi:hypothetical protein
MVCLAGSDCKNGVCQGGRCQEASCSDTVKNGQEANADCGGECEVRCLDGQDCSHATDCNSGVCASTCQAPTCDDEVANGSEPAVDCGGDCEQRCRTGQGCRIHDDCVTGACVQSVCTATLQIFYRSETSAKSAFVRPLLQLRNTGPAAVLLSELELRYFYTNDGAQGEIVDCYFAEPGCDKLLKSIVTLAPARPLADHYLSLKFSAAAGSVTVNSVYGVEVAVHEPAFANYDQAGDYSYDPSKTSYTAHDKIALYRKGTLIWGSEPPLK